MVDSGTTPRRESRQVSVEAPPIGFAHPQRRSVQATPGPDLDIRSRSRGLSACRFVSGRISRLGSQRLGSQKTLVATDALRRTLRHTIRAVALATRMRRIVFLSTRKERAAGFSTWLAGITSRPNKVDAIAQMFQDLIDHDSVDQPSKQARRSDKLFSELMTAEPPLNERELCAIGVKLFMCDPFDMVRAFLLCSGMSSKRRASSIRQSAILIYGRLAEVLELSAAGFLEALDEKEEVDFSLSDSPDHPRSMVSAILRSQLEVKDHPLPTFEVLKIAIRKGRYVFIAQPTIFHAIEREWWGAQGQWPGSAVVLLLFLLTPLLLVLNAAAVTWISIFGNHLRILLYSISRQRERRHWHTFLMWAFSPLTIPMVRFWLTEMSSLAFTVLLTWYRVRPFCGYGHALNTACSAKDGQPQSRPAILFILLVWNAGFLWMELRQCFEFARLEIQTSTRHVRRKRKMTRSPSQDDQDAPGKRHCWTSFVQSARIALNGIRYYLMDATNALEICTYVISFFALMSALFPDSAHMNSVGRQFLSAAVVLVWLRLDRMLVPFAGEHGVAVFFIITRRMIWDVLKFLLVYGLYIMAFASGFFILYRDGETSNYPEHLYDTCKDLDLRRLTWQGNIMLLVQATLRGGTGSIECAMYNPTYASATLLELVFGITTVLMLVNMLIAMLSKSFQDVYDEALQATCYAKAKLLYEHATQSSTMPPLNLLMIPTKLVYQFLRGCVLKQRASCMYDFLAPGERAADRAEADADSGCSAGSERDADPQSPMQSPRPDSRSLGNVEYMPGAYEPENNRASMLLEGKVDNTRTRLEKYLRVPRHKLSAVREAALRERDTRMVGEIMHEFQDLDAVRSELHGYVLRYLRSHAKREVPLAFLVNHMEGVERHLFNEAHGLEHSLENCTLRGGVEPAPRAHGHGATAYSAHL